MSKPIKSILLVDDDEATNYIHEVVIKRFDPNINVIAVENGQEGIEYLRSINDEGSHPCPDLIFLDINMPIMNGWEFLSNYKNLPLNQKGDIIVVMLTTSLNPDDKLRAEQIEEINDFANKPLTKDLFTEIANKFFS